jgi:hypothetical protein
MKMKRLSLFLFLAFLSLQTLQGFTQEVYEAWVALYEDADGYALAVDKERNVYITGYSATIKYSPDGDSLWFRTDVEGEDIVLDDSGSLYVCSSYGGTVKCTSGGDILWMRTDIKGYRIEQDDSGNVVVGGNYEVVKLSKYGDLLWSDSIRVNDLAVDDSGSVYVSGWRPGGSHTIKYSADGDTIWFVDDEGILDIDDNNNVYVLGGDYLAKYLPNGDTAWVRDPPLDYSPLDMKVDDSGYAHVTGVTSGLVDLDWITLKYSRSGSILWFKSFDSDISFPWGEQRLALDKVGNVYIAGSLMEEDTLYPMSDFGLLKYSANGDSLSLKRYDSPGSDTEWVSAVAVDENLNVYVTGGNYDLDTHDWYSITIKYSLCVKPGDANDNDALGLSDIVATVNYIFTKPDWPVCLSNTNLCWLSDQLCRGDWDGDGDVELSDVIRGVNFVFDKPGGPWDPMPYGACCLPVP